MTWLVTGASRGLGRGIALAALRRGDRVAATARDPRTLAPLVEEHGDAALPLQLDVTDPTQVQHAVHAAHGAFGRLDVVVNNAGYGLFGMVEEITEQQLRDQLETNVVGPLAVTRAALPFLRQQGSGHIVQISSIGGVAAFPGLGGYHASKWALEGLTEALAQEVASLGIAVTLVEPGGYATDWAGSSGVHSTPIEAYQPLRDERAQRRAAAQLGDPEAAGRALLAVVDAEYPPLRVLFGNGPLPLVEAVYGERLRTWREWAEVSATAQG